MKPALDKREWRTVIPERQALNELNPFKISQNIWKNRNE